MVLVLVYTMVVFGLHAAFQSIEVIDDEILNICQVFIFEDPLLHALG